MWNCPAIVLFATMFVATTYGKHWSEYSDAERDELSKENATRLHPTTDTGDYNSNSNETVPGEDDKDDFEEGVDIILDEDAKAERRKIVSEEDDDFEGGDDILRDEDAKAERPKIEPNSELGDYFEGDILGEDERKRSDELSKEYPIRLHPNTDTRDYDSNNNETVTWETLSDSEEEYIKEYARLHENDTKIVSEEDDDFEEGVDIILDEDAKAERRKYLD